MFNKKGLILVLLASLLFIMGMTIPTQRESEIDSLLEAFNQTSAELSQYYFHIGIPHQTLKEDELFAKGKELSVLFDIPVGKVDRFGNDLFYVGQGAWDNKTKVEIQLKNINENKMTYLVIKITGNSFDQIVTDYRNFRNLLQLAHINPKFNSCIQGNINDKLYDDKQMQLIQNVLKTLDAKVVEELNSELVTSVSAYSPKFGQVIQTGGSSMNVQVATHYNALDNKTVLTMGTPIITIEY